MARTEVRRYINHSPPVVFAYLTDLRHFPEWSSSVIAAKDVRNPTFQREGHCTFVTTFLGKRFDLPFRAVTVSEPLTLLLETSGGPVPHTWRYTVNAHGAGSELIVVVDGDPGALFKFTAPIAMQVLKRRMQADSLAIKEYLELVIPAIRAVREAQR